MKVVGLITEYNPFHNGHKYHIQKAKELTGADYAVVVMSGNFVQRGTPAIIDKYTRTKMALTMGADIVFELPVSFACASAEFFAYGAVAILEHLNFIDFLCFGSEVGSLELLEPVAEILLKEPEEFKNFLNKYLKAGNSFPVSRAMALKDYIILFSNTERNKNTPFTKQLLSMSGKKMETLLLSSNNILGIEYLKALKQLNSKIVPYTIKREGSSYSDTNLAAKQIFSSATAIRNNLEQEANFSILKSAMPKEVISLIKPLYKKTFPICENDFSDMLYYKLRTVITNTFSGNRETTKNALEQLNFYGDVSPELAARIKNLLPNFTTYCDFAMELKTKQYTLTRINRCLLHILLELPETKKELSFIRLLGFRKEASHLLKQIPDTDIPVITKMAHGNKLLHGTAKECFDKEIFCSDLYNQIVYSKYGTKISSDYKHPLIIL